MSTSYRLLIVLLLAGPSSGTAINASADYDEDLTRVYRGIKVVEVMRDVCVEQFSTFTDMEKAYAAWHSTNERLINDISQRVKVMATRKANAEPDPAKRAQVYASYVERPADVATGRAQLLGKGTDALLLSCIGWGRSALINVEGDFAAPLATVQRVPAH